MSETLRPVWIAFPQIPWGSIGWRMGGGEDYWHNWMSWFKTMPDEQRSSYKLAWPETEGWQGFYAFVETGSPPPWLTERRARIEAADQPIVSEESEITDYYRIIWLMRNQLKLVASDQPTEDEWDSWKYRSEDGALWRLASLKPEGLKLVRTASNEQIG